MPEILTELVRDFCPHCMTKVPGIVKLFCPKCKSGDLIPTPFIGLDLAKEGTKDESVVQFFDKSSGDLVELTEDDYFDLVDKKIEAAKSRIEIEEAVLDKVMNSQFLFITGLAGTGKSTLVREIARRNPDFLELTSTTGIAAINLGGKTINSTLKYFDTKSLHRIWENGYLHQHLRAVRDRAKILAIEEVSMMDGTQLDYIVDAVDEINNDLFTDKKLGVHLIGDLAQLSPIKAPWIFKSKFWPRFEENTLRLEKIWRQDNPDFIRAINLVRQGKGNDAVMALMECGVNFVQQLDNHFDGTTIIPKNDQVDAFNAQRLAQIDAKTITLQPIRRGNQLGEWNKQIPYELRLKVGAYVMILSNDSPNFSYVNGDTGEITGFDAEKEMFTIKLKRNNSEVKIKNITRYNLTDTEPTPDFYSSMFTPFVDEFTKQWVLGTISYMPLRLAYASTVHKSQGLSLDRVQIDSRHQFFGAENMAYVAISRCRTPEGLFIAGLPQHVAGKIRCAREVQRWI